MKSISLSKIAAFLAITFTLGSMIIAGGNLYIGHQVSKVQSDFEVYETSSDPKALTLRFVIGHMGYGGMIHEFKNYVLRGGSDRKDRLNRAVGASISGLVALREIVGPEFHEDVDTVIATIRAYAASVSQIDSFRAQGQSIEQIDKVIKIDDGPALAALSRLRAEAGVGSRDTRYGLLVELRNALGYGGMIHQFKNLVLRKDAPRAEKIKAAAAVARDALDRYRTLDVSAAELEHLQAIEDMIDAYSAMVPKVLSQGASGTNAADIDKAVKLSDGPALEGLTGLGIAAQEEINNLRGEVHTILNTTQTQALLVTLAALAGMVSLSALVYLAIRKFAVRPARQISEGLQALAKGDTSVDLGHLANSTEIGEIAGASSTFRDALIRNTEMMDRQRAHAEEQKRMAAEQAELLEEQKQLYAKQEAAQAKSRQAQAERERLQQAIQNVIAKAVQGELSSRIHEQFEEASLTALATGVNQLMDAITGSFDELLAALGRLAQGDFTGRIEGARSGDYEKMQNGVNSALSELSGLISEVTESTRDILQEAEVISDATVGLGERTERHAHELEQTTTSLGQLSDSIGAVADHAQDAATGVTEVGKTSAEIREVMSNANVSMDKIVESSGKISKVTALIEEISFQTNLLALNAGIEAARAGDAGRGFAVVASEVRALAQRSGEAVNEINSLIQASRSDIKEGAQQVSSAGSAVESISSAMEQIMERVGAVATKCQEQSSAVGGISSAMKRIESVSQQNAAMFEETAASTKTLHTSAEKLLKMSASFVISDAGRTTAPGAKQTSVS